MLQKDKKDFVVNVIFTTEKLGNCFSLKDRTLVPLQVGVIYKFTCGVDPQHTYIGKTIRHLGIRIREHRTTTSAISDYRMTCNSTCNVTNLEVIDRNSDDFSLKILEAIHIKRESPSLNKQLHNDGSHFICKLN